MAYYNQTNAIILMLLSLLCLNILKSVHAGGNDTLVSKMCGATYAPTVCQTCIEKDHNKGAKNESDVIQAMLKCGESDSSQLLVAVNDAIYEPDIDAEMQVTLMIIKPLIKSIIESAGTVQQQAILKKLDDARASIKNLVLAKVEQCDAKLAEPGVAIPPAVFSGFFNVEADYKLSDQLIAYVQGRILVRMRGATA